MFKLTIYTGHAAFAEAAPGHEVARILRAIADRVEAGAESGWEWDYNGNRCAQWQHTDKEDSE